MINKFVYNGWFYFNLYDNSTNMDLCAIDQYINKIVNILSDESCYDGGCTVDELQLICLLKDISDYESFNCAVFIVRNLIKIKIYNSDNNFDADFVYKVLNYLFLLGVNTDFKSEKICINKCDNENLLSIFKLAFSIVDSYYIKEDNLYKEEAVRAYRKRKYYVTTIEEDMNTYEIKHGYLREYVDKFRRFNASSIPGYIKCNQLESLLKCVEKYALNGIEGDEIFVIKNEFIRFFDKKLKDYIERFEIKCLQSMTKNPFDERWDFVCCYKSKKYIIISPNLLMRNSDIIKYMAERCCGSDSVIKVFFNYVIDDRLKNIYDVYMVYKIADVLINNEYIVSCEKKSDKYIPRVNIKNFLKDKRICNNSGDIDAVFFSPYTSVIYLVEYKNVQMLPSRCGDLKYDIRKMKKWKIYEHVRNRETLVKDNVSEFVEQVFEKDKIYVEGFRDVKSIILTTTPNFYFYQYPTDEFICMDWTEFKLKVINRDF